MIRTIHVVFSNDFFRSYSNEYMFLCNYDIVRVGDIIKDPRYSADMKVVNITTNTNRVQSGIILKDIYITHVNSNRIVQPSGLINGSITGSDFDIDKQINNNMEKRNIKVTLEQAIEWYNSGNETLRTLALTVFTEEELTLNRDYIFSKIKDLTATLIPSVDDKKFTALADLAVIAKYFNGSWKKTPSNTGYFLGQSSQGFTHGATMVKGLESLRNIGIVEHNTVMYPGIVYFKEKVDLIKAMKIMGDKAKDLFR